MHTHQMGAEAKNLALGLQLANDHELLLRVQQEAEVFKNKKIKNKQSKSK